MIEVNKAYLGGANMELGQKLKQARLDAGLSQRQLCGDTITRNMLSQIENGTAKPSLATLQVLSARLGKPVSYFWAGAPSENISLLKQAASLPPEQALSLLQGYLSPDPMLDSGYYLLLTRCYLALAEQALAENRTAYAQSLLQKAQEACNQAGEPGHIFCRQLILFQYRLGADPSLAEKLPDNTEEMLLRAKAALARNDPEKALACLAAADRQTQDSFLLKGDALMQKGDYQNAIDYLCALESTSPQQVYSRLEICYRELGNFQKAYEYACKQR